MWLLPRSTKSSRTLARARSRVARRWTGCSVILLAFCACRGPSSDPSPDRRGEPESPRLAAARRAEALRDIRGISKDDQSSRDVRVRRAALRAIARIGGDSAQALLLRGLADEDGEVVAWSAFGLGRRCAQKEPDRTATALILRAASLLPDDSHREAPATIPGDGSPAPEAVAAIADALGRCASPLAEGTLRNWLRLPAAWADKAAFGLGRMVDERHQLDTTTLVALLDEADKEHPNPTALFPFSRLSAVDAPIGKRLLTVAPRLLRGGGASRRYAIRALPLAGDSAVPLLERVLFDSSGFDATERADAARSLARLGSVGQSALGRVLHRLAWRADQVSEAVVVSDTWGPLLSTLEGLRGAPPEARSTLEQLVKIPIPEGRSPALLRRVVELRCRAAALLTDREQAESLVTCDPDREGRQGRLARLAVLDRGNWKGTKGVAWRQLAESSDPVVRMEALAALAHHVEMVDPVPTLVAALRAEEQGVVATAARLLGNHPERARLSKSERPSPDILVAVEQALKRSFPPDAIEVRAALFDAAGSLGVLSVKAILDAACTGEHPVLRSHAEAALRRLGEPSRQCPLVVPRSDKDVALASQDPTRLRFETDVGPLELTLLPGEAPLASLRVLELVRQGYYDGVVVHRVVPGFVVQLGDRGGDGYGGAGRVPLPCEPAPGPFDTRDVGMALSGPDTGSGQIFVTLGPYPHLGGTHSRIGRADRGWDRLTVGDVIRRVTVVP